MVVVTLVVLASSSLVAFTAGFQSCGAPPLTKAPFVLLPDLGFHNGPQGQSTVELVMPCSEPQPHDSGLLVML